MSSGRKPEVEEKLYSYLVKKTENGETVSNKELIKVAEDLTKSIYNEPWKPSNGWLMKFKARYGINSSKVYVKEEEEVEILVEDDVEELDLSLEEHNQLLDSQKLESSDPQYVSSQTISVVNACDILLDFIKENHFSPQEISTIKEIRSKVLKMPEDDTKYEILKLESEDERSALEGEYLDVEEELMNS